VDIQANIEIQYIGGESNIPRRFNYSSIDSHDSSHPHKLGVEIHE